MEHISVKRPSAKSLAKLKKGMPVRLSAGEGMTLCVNPASYNTITRSFAKGKGLNVSLSPDEMAENHGRGFFDAVKKGTQKFADKATDKLVNHAVKKGEEHLDRALTGKGRGLFDAVKKGTQKFADKATDKLVNHAVKKGEEHLDRALTGKGTKKGDMRRTARRAYEDTPSQMGGALDTQILEKINDLTGQNLGHLAKSSAVQAGARMLRGNMEGAYTSALHHVGGRGLSAEPMGGKLDLMKALMGQSEYSALPLGMGLSAEPMGGRLMRRREMSSVGAGGNLLGMPPALMSQPYSANFQFASRLPPAYASQIRSGSGLY